MRRVVVVDENDREIGFKTYAELQYKDIYRVTALWLTDLEKKYCLITQRKWSKHNDPGKWMMAVSGTVEEGEDYDKNIKVEIEEEIGQKDIEVKKKSKIFIDDGKHRFFVQYFEGSMDKKSAKIVIQEDEVEAYQWILITDLLNWVNDRPEDFVPSMLESLNAVGLSND